MMMVEENSDGCAYKEEGMVEDIASSDDSDDEDCDDNIYTVDGDEGAEPPTVTQADLVYVNGKSGGNTDFHTTDVGGITEHMDVTTGGSNENSIDMHSLSGMDVTNGEKGEDDGIRLIDHIKRAKGNNRPSVMQTVQECKRDLVTDKVMEDATCGQVSTVDIKEYSTAMHSISEHNVFLDGTSDHNRPTLDNIKSSMKKVHA
ncbi:hypothetical protein L2E82_30504 [Cichorium intybus]|uniref:Uncharacterized protein n=1 Tax=Cichorium intybus TaxID=13427 RepID=A0ACB9D0P4_CICIN|nr:hypothetical protein L2E82_30504 [Cichorium intybus]